MVISWNKETDTWERTPYTPEQEAFWRERALFDASCKEASALGHARRMGQAEAFRERQELLAKKDTEIENLRK